MPQYTERAGRPPLLHLHVHQRARPLPHRTARPPLASPLDLDPAGPPAHWPLPHTHARPPPTSPTGLSLPASLPDLCPAVLLGQHLPTSLLAQWLPPMTGGLQHHQTLYLNLPRRCRQTGLDAQGVTPELLSLKFYCS
jgi:hypothetical protein